MNVPLRVILNVCSRCRPSGEFLCNNFRRTFHLSTPSNNYWIISSKSCSVIKRSCARNSLGHVCPPIIFKRCGSSFNVRSFKRLLELAKPEKYKLGGAICLLFASSAISMFVPYGIGKVIDMISEQLKSTSEVDKHYLQSQLGKFCAVLVAIFVLGGACNGGRVFLMSVAGQRIARALREKIYGAILRQETAFFDKNKTGELVSRLSSDSLIVSSTLTSNVSDGLRSTISVIAGLSMMFYTSPYLSVITMTGVVPVIASLMIVAGRYMRNISKKVQDALAQANQVAEERFSNVRVVKTFGHEKYELSLFSQKLEDMIQLAFKEAKVRAAFFGLAGTTGNVMIVSALYVGAPMLGDNSLTVGQLSSFLLYAAYVSFSVNGITGMWGDLNKGLGAGARLWDLLDRTPAIASSGGIIPPGEVVGDVTFRDVTFAYPTRPEAVILQGLSLRVPAGAMTAVVGGSGSGKSTLTALLLRLYEPCAGQVLLDGRPLGALDWNWLRRHVGLVSQEPVLFSSSIRENITYGAAADESGENPSLPSVSEEQILKAAKLANADEFIFRLPDGLDTIVGERGVTLSGGQRQRIAIARALVRDPKVLLLDEATSALDAESERLVQDALEKILKGRTVLTIAHRLSTVRNANQIAVLDKGQVVEIGSYDELMSKEDSAFLKLVRLQTFKQ